MSKNTDNLEEYAQSIYQTAEKLIPQVNEVKKILKIKNTYISKQTGIPIKQLQMFLSLNNERYEIKNKSQLEILNNIIGKLQKFLNTECVDLNLIDNFWLIHQNLRNEFHFKVENEIDLIKNKIQNNCLDLYHLQYTHFSTYQNYSYTLDEVDEKESIQEDLEYAIDYLSFIENSLFYEDGIDENGEIVYREVYFTPEETIQNEKICEELRQKISYLQKRLQYFEDKDKKNLELALNTYPYDLSYDVQLQIEKSFENIEGHKLAKQGFNFRPNQQRAILEVYFDACRDKQGYLLPNHFGSGIHLLEYVNEKTYFGRFGSSNSKVKPWATEENLKNFDWQTELPTTNEIDTVYQFILNHQRVFFKDIFFENTRKIVTEVKSTPNLEIPDLIEFLKNQVDIFKPNTSKGHEYYKLMAEYYDILSCELPIKDISTYSKETIYRIVYEIIASSNGVYNFSNKLVEQAFAYVQYPDEYWRFQIYIYNFYFKYKSIEPILKFIEEQSIE